MLFLDFPRLQKVVNTFERLGWIRLAGVAALILFDFWFYLYSPVAGCVDRFVVAIDLFLWPHGMDYYGDCASSSAFRRLGGIYPDIRPVSFPAHGSGIARSFYTSMAYRLAVLLGYFMILVLAVGLFSPLYKKMDSTSRFMA